LRPEEVLPLHWTKQNWPDFIANKIHVTCAYEATSKVLGPPKTDQSIRDVDMVPAVRQALLTLASRREGGLTFTRQDGSGGCSRTARGGAHGGAHSMPRRSVDSARTTCGTSSPAYFLWPVGTHCMLLDRWDIIALRSLMLFTDIYCNRSPDGRWNGLTS